MQRNKKCTHFLQNCNKDWKVFCLLWSNVVSLFSLCEDSSTFVGTKSSLPKFVSMFNWHRIHSERRTEGETEDETENCSVVQTQRLESM